MKELIARINALQRRTSLKVSDNWSNLRLNQGRFIVNFESQEIYVDGKTVNLTMTEFKILNILVRHPRKYYTRQTLSYEVQGYRSFGVDRAMDSHIKNIRRKIEPEHKKPEYIITKIGAGYRFNYFPDEKQ